MNNQQLEQVVRSVVQELLTETTVQEAAVKSTESMVKETIAQQAEYGSPQKPVSETLDAAASSIVASNTGTSGNGVSGKTAANGNAASRRNTSGGGSVIKIDVPDISAVNLLDTLLVEDPLDAEAYMELKRANPARLGVGRAGPRQNTATLLRFRADHAASMDSVLNDVPEETIEELGLLNVKTAAANKAVYLMDPGIGRIFEPETAKLIKEKCKAKPKVQIIVSDGLSSISVENNIRDVLPALLQGLKVNNLDVGTNMFVRFGRVGIMDAVTEILEPEVTILFIGERPGLVTNESLSCYMTYKGYPGMPENMRTVVSNIYKEGTSPSEAGAHIAGIAKKMVDLKVSGMELKL